MPVSRRLRFEILRRDGHTCRYCGGSAPDVKLTVDHVTPQALGGKDDPENLVAACVSCNGGKSSINPDGPIVADVAADAVRWAHARAVAVEEWRHKRRQLATDLEEFHDAWVIWGAGEGDDRVTVPLGDAWEVSIERWLDEGLIVEDLIELIPKAMRSKPQRPLPLEDRWRYYCGVVWRTLDGIANATDPTSAADAEGDNGDVTLTADELDQGIRSVADSSYAAGFEDGRDYERSQSVRAVLARSSDVPYPYGPRLCIECDTRFEHGTSGVCSVCMSEVFS